MRNTVNAGLILCLGMYACAIQKLAFAAEQTALPIVPGLYGFGAATTAGSGRHLYAPSTKIFRVTNLNANGPGSLQDCVHAAGARTCVFEVSGTIDLTGDRSYDGSALLNLKNPFITIAGQTAPSPGITIKGKTLRIEAHDVLIQHLRFRVGDSPGSAIDPEVRDAVLIAGKTNDPKRTPHNIVIDHCSISWGIDEVVSIKDSSNSITLSNNIISEGLDRSLHPKGRHSKGLMAVGNYQTIYRNLFANLRDRTPLDISPNSVYVNNLSHNSKYATFSYLSRSKYYERANLSRRASLIANVRMRGADTSDRRQNIYGIASSKLRTDSKFYVSDNLCAQAQQFQSCTVQNIESLQVGVPPISNEGMDIWPASLVKENLLASVGARPVDRDKVDQRIIDGVLTNTAKVPDCVDGNIIYYPTGEVAAAARDSISFYLANCYPERFVGQSIEIVAGAGKGQARNISQHGCGANGDNRLLLDKAWSSVLDTSSRYQIVNLCSRHAGGWPALILNRKTLSIPANPNQLMPSGYTRLEEYLHVRAAEVEGRD